MISEPSMTMAGLLTSKFLRFAVILLAMCLDESNAMQPFRKLRQQKRSVIIGAVPMNAGEGVDHLSEWSPTFENYLNKAVGNQFEPPLKFTLIPLTVESAFQYVESGLVDFVFGNPSLCACLEAEFSVSVVATLKTKVGDGESSYFGGVIFTRANNTKVNSIVDLKNKIIEASSILSMGSGQTQWQEMRKNGLDLLVDPAQVIFVGHEQSKVVDDVLNGKADVGLVRSGYIEHLERLNQTRKDFFKFIHVQKATGAGSQYPAVLSTQLYPQWPLVSTVDVSRDLHLQVASALTTLNWSHPAAVAGGYSSWEPPHSYSSVTLMNVGLGIYDHVNARRCIRESDLYSAVSCPPGHFKLSKEEVGQRCALLKLACPKGYHCVCSPCQKAEAIEVYLAPSDPEVHGSASALLAASVKCNKMESCGITEQRAPLLLHVVDNMKRPDVRISYHLWHPGDKHYSAVMGAAGGPAPSLRTEMKECVPCESEQGKHCFIKFESADLGWHFVQVLADGVQIPNSPFILQVIPRQCEAGSRRIANAEGFCVCEAGTVAFRDKCISLVVLQSTTAIFITIVFVLLLALHAKKKIAAADHFRFIDISELIVSEPKKILGTGAFGEVFAAEYRGTMVAVKRALPHRETKRMRRASWTVLGVVPSVPVMPSRCPSSPGRETGNPPEACIRKHSSFSDRSDEQDMSAFDTPSRLPSTPHVRPVSCHEDMSPKHTSRSTVTQVDSSWRKIQKKFDLLSRNEFESFEQKVRMFSRLRHPCITTLMGAVVNGEEPLMVMELMDRGSLHDLLHNNTLVLEDELLFPLLRDVIQGMRFLHACSPPILHGDLKSKNILVDSNFHAKVSDFGMFHEQNFAVYESGGSVLWMAPEMLLGGPITSSTDVYAFGITLFECLSRKNPYENEDTNDVLRDVADLTKPEPRRPRLTDPSRCSPILLNMMHSCWSPFPSSRPSFESMGRQMRQLEDEGMFSCISVSAERHRSTSRKVHSTLAGIFPTRVMQALLEGRPVEPESREVVTIFFSDIADFTNISSAIGPEKTTKMLNRLYTRFDTLAAEHRIFKVETIGDAYIAVTNLAEDQPQDHAARLARFALDAVEAAQNTLIDPDTPDLGAVQIRVGLHSGPVVASAVGTQCLKYTLFGDSVNVASRMESSSLPNRVHCSMATANLLKTQDPAVVIEDRGEIEVKGKGRLRTCWIVGNACENATKSLHDRKD